MHKVLLSLAALSLVSACVPAEVPATPSAVAQKIKVDEQVALTAHLAYKAFRLAVETGVKAGVIKGTLAGHVADLDNQIYSALQAVDAAYAAGNATNLSTAVANFNTALTVGYTAIGGR